MKKIFIFAFILSGALAAANAQTIDPATPQQMPQTTVGTTRTARTASPQKDANQSVDKTRGGVIAKKNPVYRRPTKEDLRLAAPDAAAAAKYEAFLRQPKTGLVRLLSDQGCQENVNLVNASDFCIRYKNLFGGSSFSFRKDTYTLGRFADVVYKNGVLYSYGKMTLGFIADLGEGVAPADVSSQTPGAKYIFDFAAPVDLASITAASANFQNGFRADGFIYRKAHRLQENHTYLLRSVAYRRREQVERNKIVYDDLNNDERRDVIIVFQVVGLSGDAEGGATLLWKELRRTNAAKIEMNKK